MTISVMIASMLSAFLVSSCMATESNPRGRYGYWMMVRMMAGAGKTQL
jgi:hypothetical protein